MGQWDKGVDYEKTYNLILKTMLKNIGKNKVNACYDAVLLIQLRNGLRISEAVRSFKKYLTTGEKELYVELSKKKTHEERLTIIPDEIYVNKNVKKICSELIKIVDDKLVKRVKVYSLRKYRINTHSLRYSFITYLLEQGVNPAIVSKIVKHSKLDLLLTYVQKRIADDVLKNLDYFR
ncbi:MAG: hypothetical protein QW607_04455 [Desulfurococcaceae archaeon]